jgi:glycosyltransferase involved in cell wall biosynthesis
MTRQQTAGSKPVIAVAANDSRTIVNYRGGLIMALQKAGFNVVAMSADGPEVPAILDMGVKHVTIPVSARGTSPVADLRTLSIYYRRLKALRPVAFLGFTIKPNIYGSIAAHALGIRVINNITGLGAMFSRRTVLTRLVTLLYRRALRRAATVFFQNRDDLGLFRNLNLVSEEQAHLLPGSGVDLSHFAPRPRKSGQPFTFLFVARLLWDKGVGEYVDAARRVLGEGTDVGFHILGIIEPPGPSAIPEAKLRQWQEEGVIRFLGSARDVRDAFADADCVVLPSYYREGVPRVLLEAAAMAIPVITTDTPGCRDAVDDGETGLLCAPRNVDSLVAAIERMRRLSITKRQAMGRAARSKMEREFREEIVHRAYLEALAKPDV